LDRPAAFKDKAILFKSWLAQRYLDRESIWGLLKHFGYRRIAVFGGAPLGRAIHKDLCEAGFSVPALIDSHCDAYMADFPKLPWKDADFLGTRLLDIDLLILTIEGPHDLQVLNPEFYTEQAEHNRIKALPILAPRGKILDREGRVIVDNHSSFSLLLSREGLKTDQVRRVADGLQLDYNDIESRLRRYSWRPGNSLMPWG
jgi:hypothetical protein